MADSYLALWRLLDPDRKCVLTRSEFIKNWKQVKNSPEYKNRKLPRPTMSKSTEFVSIFHFTHAAYYVSFKSCYNNRFGSVPFPAQPLTIDSLYQLLADISFPLNPRTFIRLLLPRAKTVSLAAYNALAIDHFVHKSRETTVATPHLQSLGRYPSEAIAVWRSLSLAQRRKKALEVFHSKAKRPKLINLWPDLKEVVGIFRDALDSERTECIAVNEFNKICTEAGFAMGSYEYRILYAYLVKKTSGKVTEDVIDLRRVPRGSIMS